MLRYGSAKLGTVTIVQKFKDEDIKYTIQIRDANCIAAFIYVRRATPEELEKNPAGKWYHQLYTFFADEQHMKNIMKDYGDIMCGERVVSVKLNMYYKECYTLLKYFVKSGHKVTCYYKEEKKK